MGTMKMTTVKMTSGLPIPAIVHGDAAGSAQRYMFFSTSANTWRCSANCNGWLMCRYPLSPLLPLPCHLFSPTHLHWVTRHVVLCCWLHHSSTNMGSGAASFPLAVCHWADPTARAGRGRTVFQPSDGGKEGLEAFLCHINGIVRTLWMWKHL